MNTIYLDLKLIKQFISMDPVQQAEFRKVNKLSLFIPSIGFLPSVHFLYTLKAHSRGKIHAKHIGVSRTYGPTEQHWYSAKGNHPTHQQPRHPVASKQYKHSIKTLEDQALFLGPWLHPFMITKDEWMENKAQHLEQSAQKIRAKIKRQTTSVHEPMHQPAPL